MELKIGQRVIYLEGNHPYVPLGSVGTLIAIRGGIGSALLDIEWDDFEHPCPRYVDGHSVCAMHHTSTILPYKPESLGINVWVRPKAENNIVNEAVRVLACTFNFISKFFKLK